MSLMPTELLTNGLITVICFAGICLNFCLVYVTIRTKSFHSPCKTLIALYAFCASFLLFGNTIKFFIFMFGINAITLWHCAYIQFVPLIGTSFAVGLQLGIGIDRLCGVTLPIWYISNGKIITFKLTIAFCCIRAAITAFSIYIGSSNHWDLPVMCYLGDPNHQPETQQFTDIHGLITYCGEFLCYAMIWLIIWRKNLQISEYVKKLTISLCVLMSINLICFVLNTLFFKFILPMLNFEPATIEYIVLPLSLALQSMAYGSSAPMLYMCIAEYRSAFRKHFGGHPQTVHVANVHHLNNYMGTIN